MSNELVLVGFYFFTLIYSVVIHEVSHGWMALSLGDPTAKYEGRLDLNLAKHIDPLGSIVVPIGMFLMTGFAFGWAKPVPYNPYNLRNQKWGPAMVALAGPLSNIALASFAVLIGRILPVSADNRVDMIRGFFGVIGGHAGGFLESWHSFASAMSGSFPNVFFGLMLLIVFWNVLLAFFNLIPIPPLDGSKLLYTVLSLKAETVMFLERYGMFILLFFIFFVPGVISFVLGNALDFFFGMMI